jgi:epsin
LYVDGDSQLLNEIMPMIYHRFTEKTAEQWRQIYKALQLLEFLIKNGSERVIDDARSHLSLLKMLRQFHFIDANGKDQGINVRNRSKELTDLLSDVEKIRQERKKARGNRQKYSGYEGGGGLGGGSSSRASGGFGSGDNGSYGAYDGRVYGDGGGFGGTGAPEFEDTQARRDNFEEYDETEDGAGAGGSGATTSRRKTSNASKPPPRRAAKKAEPPKPKEPEVDLFDFGDEPTSSAPTLAAAPPPGFAALQSSAPADDDDFDDFVSAPIPAGSSSGFSIAPPTSTTTANTQFAQPQPVSGTQAQNLNDLFASVSPPPGSTSSSTILSGGISGAGTPSIRTAQPTSFQPPQPNYYTSVQSGISNASTPSARPAVATTPGGLGKPIGISSGAKPKAAGGDAFAGLLGGVASKKTAAPAGKLSMADMARQKASAGIWGAGSPAAPPAGGASKPAGQPQKPLGNGLDDLLG